MTERTTVTSPALGSIIRGDLCLGCGLCASLSGGKLSMDVSADGYLRPVQSAPLSPELDRSLAEVCPGAKLTQQPSEFTEHPLWGPVAGCHIGASTDEQVRFEAASGGALSSLLIYLVESGKVDRVVQISTSDSKPLENKVQISRSPLEIRQAAGSRYAPSAPLQDLDAELNKPGVFALVGKPCDIAAVRALGLKDQRVDEKIGCLMSFFCGGVPSLRGGRKVLDRLHVADTDLKSFRYRGHGWPGKATATLMKGTTATMDYKELWGDILSKNLQYRCKICPDGSGGTADIVCADAWETDENGYPAFQEADGQSLILTRTERGKAILSAALSANYVVAKDCDVENIARMQPSQANRKRLILSRLAPLLIFGRRVPSYRGFNLTSAAIKAGVWANIKSALGMTKRLLRN